MTGGGLWRCLNCGFQFRDPLLGEVEYERLYAEGALGVWDGEQLRHDFDLIRRQLAELDGKVIDVLDVGCYTGDLLASLPKSFRLHGVETNREASNIAASRGVTVIASRVQDIAGDRGQFDVITACDVIEHLPDPLEFLGTLRANLKPGGRIIITTGNCDSWLWRLLGSGYWYCSFPEHISFIGSRWVAREPPRIRLKLVSLAVFNYVGGWMSLSRILQSVIYRVSPGFYGALRRIAGKGSLHGSVPGNGAIRDHMLCIFESV